MQYIEVLANSSFLLFYTFSIFLAPLCPQRSTTNKPISSPNILWMSPTTDPNLKKIPGTHALLPDPCSARTPIVGGEHNSVTSTLYNRRLAPSFQLTVLAPSNVPRPNGLTGGTQATPTVVFFNALTTDWLIAPVPIPAPSFFVTEDGNDLRLGQRPESRAYVDNSESTQTRRRGVYKGAKDRRSMETASLYHQFSHARLKSMTPTSALCT